MFFSEASARGTSIMSVSCFPSESMNLALKDPFSGGRIAVTSCCILALSVSSLRCRLDGGGITVAMTDWIQQSVEEVLPVKDRWDEMLLVILRR